MRNAPPNARGSSDDLARFLVDGGPIPEAADLAAAGLEAMAYARLSQEHPERDGWRTAYVTQVASHLATAATLTPLVTAWRGNGIDVIIFKGFYLAESLYANAAERTYHDVDILIREADADGARRIAVEQGWEVAASRTGATSRNVHSHMEMILTRSGVVIDLHRFAIHCASSDERVARRYTDAAWLASREVPWRGTTIRTLDPRDSVLLGLIVARAWSHDGWFLKPTDYADMQVLARGMQRDDVRQRAAELGCSRTADLVLERCDPWRRRLDLRPPTRALRRRWSRAVAAERGPGQGWWLARQPGASLTRMAAALPGLVRTKRLLRHHDDPVELVAHLGRPQRGAPPLTEAGRASLFANVRLGSHLVQLRGDRCMLRSFALFEALRAHGEPVTLHVGTDEAGRWHAWVRYAPASPHPESWARCTGVVEVAGTRAHAGGAPT